MMCVDFERKGVNTHEKTKWNTSYNVFVSSVGCW